MLAPYFNNCRTMAASFRSTAPNKASFSPVFGTSSLVNPGPADIRKSDTITRIPNPFILFEHPICVTVFTQDREGPAKTVKNRISVGGQCQITLSMWSKPKAYQSSSPQVGSGDPSEAKSRDHSEFMVLALQPAVGYWESFLGVAGQQALTGERLARASPTLVST